MNLRSVRDLSAVPVSGNFFLGEGCKFLSTEYILAALHHVNEIRIF